MTTSQLINAVIKRAQLPSGGEMLYASAEDILHIISSVLYGELFPMYLQLSGSHYLTHSDAPLLPEVAMPKNAYHSTLQDVKLLKPSGLQENIPRLPLGMVASGQQGFALQGNTIYFYGYEKHKNPVVRLYYHKQPTKLTAIENSLHVPFASAKFGTGYAGSNPGAIEYITFKIKAQPERISSMHTKILSLPQPDLTPPLRLLFQSADSPLITIPLKVKLLDKYPANADASADAEFVLWLNEESGLSVAPHKKVLESGGYLTLAENESEVVIPQLPSGSEDILIDKTVLQMAISGEVRSRVSASLAEKMQRLEQFAIRRVHYETQSLTSTNPLWE